MSDDLDALLREHYRRAAEGIQPDAELIDRYRGSARPTRTVPAWPRMLLAAAAVAGIALLTWGLLKPDHPGRRSVPLAPPPATSVPSPSTTHTSPRTTNSSTPGVRPHPLPTRRPGGHPKATVPPTPSPTHPGIPMPRTSPTRLTVAPRPTHH
ncbi:hypothetical protein GCM10023196_079050 [Actinoallomurus vinaceus]|uniref:DUF3040 domain-containing protein n=1 Tax=Actinoallomurus vinaceus TaxID=1080074 RepID=A0ABP8UR55_9ACTN